MTKLPRLWDEKITTAKGRKVRRFSICENFHKMRSKTRSKCYVVCDHAKISPRAAFNGFPQFIRGFRTRQAAENWLKRTTVRSYQLQELNAKLRM